MSVGKRRQSLFVALTVVSTLLLSPFAWGQKTVTVPLDHWAYDVVDRFQTRGYLTDIADLTRPYTRGEFVAFILRADSVISGSSSAIDRGLLQKLQVEFREDLEDCGIWKSDLRGQSHLVKWHGEDYRLFLDPVVRLEGFLDWGDTYSETEKNYRHTVGITTRGYLKNSLDFYLYTHDNRLAGDHDYTRRSEIDDKGVGYVTFEEGNVDYDKTEASVSVKTKWFDLTLGRNSLRWGPGSGGQLLLSDQSPAIDMVRLTAATGRIKFTYLTGVLQTDLVDSTLSYTPGSGVFRGIRLEKKIAAHRLEFRPHRNLDLALSEVVIYGERDWELGYMIPVVFMWSEEHNLQDRDNLLMGLDFRWNFHRGWKLYGELIVDDVFIGKLTSDWYGNKWGASLGLSLVDPLGLRGVDLAGEYTRLEPYLYTHFFPINVYKNHHSPLGHWLQPNSDLLYFDGGWWVSPHLREELQLSFMRHGANPPGGNVGGDIDLAHQDGDPDEKSFLDGIREKRLTVQNHLSYEPYPEFFVHLRGGLTRSQNMLKSDGGRGDFTDYRIALSLTYRYY
jgi:hypothetical protein